MNMCEVMLLYISRFFSMFCYFYGQRSNDTMRFDIVYVVILEFCVLHQPPASCCRFFSFFFKWLRIDVLFMLLK